MRISLWLTTVAILLLMPQILWSQAPSPKIHPFPLSRLEPIVVIQSSNGIRLLEIISDTIKHAGFKINRLDRGVLLIVATRADDAPSKDYDQILIWLERDFKEPLKFISLYFLYGRFEEILAKEKGVYRIIVDTSFEEERVGKLKQALISLSTSNGG